MGALLLSLVTAALGGARPGVMVVGNKDVVAGLRVVLLRLALAAEDAWVLVAGAELVAKPPSPSRSKT